MTRDDVIDVRPVAKAPQGRFVAAPVPLLSDDSSETTVGDLLDAVFDAGGLVLVSEEEGAPAEEGAGESLLPGLPQPARNAIAKVQLELGLESEEEVVRALIIDMAMKVVRVRARAVAVELRSSGYAYENYYGE